MNNKKVAAGLNGLLAPTPKAQEQAQAPTAEKQKYNYKSVCYSIPPEVAERIKEIAYWDRKKINAVVVEAFTQYADRWDKENGGTKK